MILATEPGSIGHSLEDMGHTVEMVGHRDSHVTVLLSTFDGAAWLPDLLDSLAAQGHRDWTLLVRDDGSTDDSVAVVSAAARADDRIRLVDDGAGNLGPAASFMSLLARVSDGLFAFCDQDDVWLPQKLDVSIESLPDDPIAAVFSDAVVTDANGTVIGGSALRDRGVRGEVPFGQLLINNAVIGATVLGTAPLARRAVELATADVFWHDWWVALVAAHQGTLTRVDEPLLCWRRHEHTVTGDRPSGLSGRAARRRAYLAWSIDVARWLRDAGAATSAEADRAVYALSGLDPRHPTLSGLLRAWRIGGVRAWPLRGQASLLLSVARGRTGQ